MVGIYKIENLITGKIYIGQSVEVEERIKEHKRIPFRENRPTYNYPLYKDMRELGIENFSFQVLLECKKEELNKFEKEKILQYNSYKDGYNQTPGGDSTASGNNSNHHILTEEDVFNIRIRFKNKEPRWVVYKDYEDKISIDTFVHVWLGKTWQWCFPEVFTPENLKWHENNLGEPSLVNKQIKMTAQEVKDIRQRKQSGFKRSQVYQDYKEKISLGAFNAIWYNQSWKGVI